MRSLLLLLLATVSLDAQVIRGRVVDADGKPVEGAIVRTILATRAPLDFVDHTPAKTDKDGRYRLDAPPFERSESVAVAVALPAHATVRSAPFVADVREHEVNVTLPRFETVTLHVVDRDGKPLPKPRVAFAPSDDTVLMPSPAALLMERFAETHVTGDEAGKLTLHLLPGTWDLAAIAEEHLPATIVQREIKRATALSMTLEKAMTIRGRVHRKGRGVAEATVVVLQPERRTFDEIAATTDADGAFELRGLPPGLHRLAVRKDKELLQRILEAKAPGAVDIALPPAATLITRVIDGDSGEAIREFAFEVESLDPLDRAIFQATKAGDQETVELTVSPGTYRISATARGYTPDESVEVRVTDREPALVTVVLDRGITISGRIVAENDAPVVGARVFVEANRGPRRNGPRQAESADDGTYTVTGLEAGDVNVTVRADGFVPWLKPLALDGGTTLDVRLSRGLSIDGIVRRAGKPVAGVQIDAATAAFGGAQAVANSDANGRFTLRGLSPARYTISAYTDSANTELGNVDPTKTREIALSLDPKPTGVVFGVVTGIPSNVPGKMTRRVVWVRGGDRGVEATIDANGQYRIEDAPAGPVELSAQVEWTTSSMSSMVANAEVIPGQEVRADLHFDAAFGVRGRVTYNGKPATGVRVVFTSDNNVAGSATSRADGTYAASLPAAGRYQIFVHSELLSIGNLQLVRDIRGGETIDIELREQTVLGTVVNAITREPIPNAFVTLTPENGPARWSSGEATTDPEGRFAMVTAGTGSHRLVAWADGYAHRAQTIQLGSGADVRVAFELTRTTALHLRVVDAASGTILGGEVMIATPDGVFLPVRCDRSIDGVSNACSLAPGRYRVTVTVPGYADRTIEVTAPGEVEVRLE